MKYSVIIPCFNEGHVLTASLDALTNAVGNRDDIEILLLDNGSSDDSMAIASRYPLTLIKLVGVRISALRNHGAKLSCGEYLVFMDADIKLPKNWFQLLDDYTEQDKVAAVGFVDTVPEHAPWFARIWSLKDLARRNKLQQVDALPGRNLMVSRIWFERINGFNSELITGEDKDFVMRIARSGGTVMSDPGADVVHLGFERDFLEWCRKEYWRQHSHIRLIQHQGATLRLLRFPLLAVSHWLMAAMVCSSALTLGSAMTLALVFLWFVPSLGMSVAHSASRWPPLRLLQFSLLYWLRFHVAGFSVLREAWELQQKRKTQWS